MTCFVNGQRAGSSDSRQRFQTPVQRHLTVKLNAGANTLAFLTAHNGRNKLYNYYGPMDTIDAKGISGTVALSSPASQAVDITQFRWQADDQGMADAAKMAAPGLDTTGADWHDATTSTDVFNRRVGSAWFRATLPTVPGPNRRLHFNSIDDMGQIFLNGKQIASNIGINAWADIALGDSWNENGPNVLAVTVQNIAGAGGILGRVTLQGNITVAPGDSRLGDARRHHPAPAGLARSGNRCPEAPRRASRRFTAPLLRRPRPSRSAPTPFCGPRRRAFRTARSG